MLDIRLVGPAEKPHLFVNGVRFESLCLIAEKSRSEQARELCFKIGRHWRTRFHEWEARTDEFMLLFSPKPSTLRTELPAVRYTSRLEPFRREVAGLSFEVDGRPCVWMYVLPDAPREILSLILYEQELFGAGHG